MYRRHHPRSSVILSVTEATLNPIAVACMPQGRRGRNGESSPRWSRIGPTTAGHRLVVSAQIPITLLSMLFLAVRSSSA